MGFDTGRKKTGGRKAGTPNKITTRLRDRLYQLAQDELSEVPTYLDELTPQERSNFLLKLLPYICPTYSDRRYVRTELKANPADWDGMHLDEM